MKNFLLIIVLVILLCNEFNAQWVNISPLDENGAPFSQNLTKIFILPSSSIIVGGQEGLLLKSDNGGNTWEKLTSPDYYKITDIYFISDQVGFVSNSLYLYKTVDGGNTWQQIKEGCNYVIAFNSLDILTIDNWSRGVLHEVIYESTVANSVDGGLNWTEFLPFGKYDKEAADLYFKDANRIFTVIFNMDNYTPNYIYQSQDKGTTWSIFSKISDRGYVRSFKYFDDSLSWCIIDSMAAGLPRFIKKSTDGGITWNKSKFTESPSEVYSLDIIDRKNVWACGNGGMLYNTTNGGETWNSAIICNNSLAKIVFTDSKTGYVIGSQGSIYKTTTGGSLVSTDNSKEEETPNSFNLYQNYPNPFNPTTTINYSIPEDQLIELKVYDVMGNEVADLVNEYKPAGNYSVTLNASDLASGVYFYRIKAGNNILTKKLTLIK